MSCGSDIPITLGKEMQALESYSLSPSDEVWVIGSFKGATAKVIFDLYQTEHILCFDPQPHAIEEMKKLDIPIDIRPYGLGDREGQFEMMEVGNDACSFFGKSGKWGHFDGDSRFTNGPFLMKDICNEWRGEDISLIIMNCEGSESILIPRMIECGMMKMINHLLIQYHVHVVPERGWENILLQQMETHRPGYNHWPVWVSWKRY